MADVSSNILTRLRQLFRVTPAKLPNSDKTVLHPATTKDNILRKIKFKDEYSDLYTFWLSDTYDTSQTVKDRFDRYKSLEYAFYNNTIFSKAVNMYADEAIQEDVQSEAIEIGTPDRKVYQFIKDFFKRTHIDNESIKDATFNMCLYGDAFWIGPTNENGNGYSEFLPTSVYNVLNRLEFNASEEMKKRNRSNKYDAFITSNTRLNMLDKLVQKQSSDISSLFTTFLFGFQLDKDTFLPPWNLFHFRVATSQSEFAPYGRPIMINSLAPFRQLQSAKNLMALLRVTNFPLKVFEVQVDETLDPQSKWEIVNQAREQYANLGSAMTGKEEFTMNSEVWLPSGLVSMSVESPNANTDQIGDIEMLRDDLIMGTDIPKGYLIVDRGAFGVSSQSLLAQHKPFARKEYDVQQAILKTIAQMIRLEFVLSGKFSYDTPFELTMAFPSTEESRDRLGMKTDTLRLAKDIIDNLVQVMGLDRDEALPPDIVKQILSKFSFLDAKDVDSWVNKITKSKDEALHEGMKKKIEERLSDDIIQEVYFKSKERLNLREGIMNGKHFYSSFNIEPRDRAICEILSRSEGKLVE